MQKKRAHTLHFLGKKFEFEFFSLSLIRVCEVKTLLLDYQLNWSRSINKVTNESENLAEVGLSGFTGDAKVASLSSEILSTVRMGELLTAPWAAASKT